MEDVINIKLRKRIFRRYILKTTIMLIDTLLNTSIQLRNMELREGLREQYVCLSRALNIAPFVKPLVREGPR